MKRLDQVSKTILQNALRFTGRLRVVEAPRNENNDEEGPASHQPGVTIAYALDQYGTGKEGRKKRGVDEKWGRARRLAACFDPLDGSGNADAAICTGTVVCLSIDLVSAPLVLTYASLSHSLTLTPSSLEFLTPMQPLKEENLQILQMKHRWLEQSFNQEISC